MIFGGRRTQNPKYQIPNPRELPKPNTQVPPGRELVIGTSMGFGGWGLGFL
jgi:hypothetical protein